MEAKEIIESELSEKNILDKISNIFFGIGIVVVIIGIIFTIGTFLLSMEDNSDIADHKFTYFVIGISIIFSGLWFVFIVEVGKAVNIIKKYIRADLKIKHGIQEEIYEEE